MDFIKEEKFLDKLGNYWLLITVSVQWNLLVSRVQLKCDGTR